MDYTRLSQPIADTFAKVSAIFATIEAPPPWNTELNKFSVWGNAAGIGPYGPRSPAFADEVIREDVLASLQYFEEDFANDRGLPIRTGLTHKKKGGGVFKKGLKKLAGKGSSNSEGGQKLVVQFPDVWASKMALISQEIDALRVIVPVDESGMSTVTTGMGGLAVSDQQPQMPVPPPAPTTAAAAASTTTAAASTANDEPSEAEQERMWAEMDKLEEFIRVKDKGALGVILSPSTNYSTRVRVSVYYDDENTSKFWQDEAMGYVKMGHGSFELYHRRRYMKPSTSKYSTDTDEDSVLFDVESNPKYENINPGTCTLEGFGMEAWDYELAFGRPRDNTCFVSYATLPDVSAKQLIRRMDEFQKSIGSKFGWTPKKDKHDLEEFFGNMGITYYVNVPDNSPMRIGDLYQQMNRRDIFTDFTSVSSISTQWSQPRGEGVMGVWNFLYQLVLAKELALRLLNIADGSYAGFTARVLASLTVQDLWLSNVRIELSEPPIAAELLHKAKTPEDVAEVERHMNQGHEAAKTGQWQVAVDEYTEAMKIDNSVSMYSTYRALAYMALSKHEHAHDDATAAVRLNPKDKLAWSAMGDAGIGIGNLTRAKEAYQNALALAGGVDEAIKKKLDDVTKKINERIDAINKEANENLAFTMEKKHNDEKFDIAGRTVEFHSKIHERQVEGLILFAERIKWPWVHEVREAAEDVYGKIRGGAITPFHVVDWIFGLTLPGEWMSLKIMSALVLLTESVKKEGIAPYYDCGFVAKQKSYHRIRNVLGRVLGCLPGVISLCGWIGPCPPVTFDPPLLEGIGAGKKGKHIRVKARRIGLVDPPDPADNVIRIGGGGSHLALRPKPGDDFDKYVLEIKDPANWVAPPVPQKTTSTTKLLEIILKALPLESGVDTSDPDNVERNTEYRATLKFDVDGERVSYSLYTNPVFATPPPCSGGTKGVHEIHKRELSQYQNSIEAEKLKEYTPEDEDIVLINATGTGAEVLARAWCAERGRAAVIRRIGGPCLACTMKTVVELKQKVVIWVS